jgi:hypothetical protein
MVHDSRNRDRREGRRRWLQRRDGGTPRWRTADPSDRVSDPGSWSGTAERRTLGRTEETFRLIATESPDRTGALVIRLPDDLYRVHVVEIS